MQAVTVPIVYRFFFKRQIVENVKGFDSKHLFCTVKAANFEKLKFF